MDSTAAGTVHGTARPARGPRRGTALRGPFSRRAWRDVAFVAAGGAYLTPLAATLSAGLEVAVPVAVVMLLLALVLLPRLLGIASRVQRSRFWALQGLDLHIVPLSTGRPRWSEFVFALRSGAARRQIAYHLVAAPVFAVAGVAVALAWPAGLAMAFATAYISLLPASSPLRSGDWPDAGLTLTLGGLALLWLTPLVAHVVGLLDTRAATRLLGPDRELELEQRVAGLTESRSAVVQAADAERRRIERDLHDGAQQRLVSLAINLGLARATLTGASPEAMKVIAEAHDEAKAVLAELRDLVRGLHPAVLDDRGLDAALSGIAARAPLPVRLRVDVPIRPSPAVEAVAYFVVSESLANISKHARASEARVEVERVRNRLHLTITDDGIGGADPARGSGLAGLARRASTVDGTFQLSSPVGGPTVITVELPCVP